MGEVTNKQIAREVLVKWNTAPLPQDTDTPMSDAMRSLEALIEAALAEKDREREEAKSAEYQTAWDAGYAAAIDRLAPKPGHVRVLDPDGVVRRVLGTLPATADGCVIGRHADLYRTGGGSGPCHDGTSFICVKDNSSHPDLHHWLGDWHSTRAAAESARNSLTPPQGGQA